MKIGEVARRSGLNTSTLRYYEDIGLISPPERRSGQRIYYEDIFTRLKIIKLAQETGFTLGEIQRLLSSTDSHKAAMVAWVSLANDKLDEIEAMIAHYQSMKQLLQRGLECQCIDLEECEVLDRV